MANEDLFQLKTFCCICTTEVPPERLKFRSITCTKEHQAIRERMLRKRASDRACLFCKKPSTPNRRRSYTRFSKWERTFPNLAYPEVWAIVEPAGMDLKSFGRAVTQSVKLDVELDPALALIDWDSTKIKRDETGRGIGKKGTPELDRCLSILAAYNLANPQPIREEVAEDSDDEL